MNFSALPNSKDRFARRLAQREGFEFTAGRSVHCQLFDSAIGGSGPSTTEIVPTVSGSGRSVAGNKNQTNESGIQLGTKGTYLEAGSQNNVGQKNSVAYNVGKGGSLVINQAPPSPLTGMASTQPIASLTAGPGVVQQPATVPPDTSATPSPAPSTPSPFWQKVEEHWAAWSTWQKVGAGVASVLILWLFFHRRRA